MPPRPQGTVSGTRQAWEKPLRTSLLATTTKSILLTHIHIQTHTVSDLNNLVNPNRD